MQILPDTILLNRVDNFVMKTIRYLFFVLCLCKCLPIVAFSGRYGPFFPHFHSQYVIRGVILKNKLLYQSSYVVLYSPQIAVLNDFDLGVRDTIVLLPDTIGMNNNDPIIETGWYLKEGEEYYIDFIINKYGQLCYRRFFDVRDGKVLGNFTNWQEFLIRRFRISPRGMSVERFEKKLKKKLKKQQLDKCYKNNDGRQL